MTASVPVDRFGFMSSIGKYGRNPSFRNFVGRARSTSASERAFRAQTCRKTDRHCSGSHPLQPLKEGCPAKTSNTRFLFPRESHNNVANYSLYFHGKKVFAPDLFVPLRRVEKHAVRTFLGLEKDRDRCFLMFKDGSRLEEGGTWIAQHRAAEL